MNTPYRIPRRSEITPGVLTDLGFMPDLDDLNGGLGRTPAEVGATVEAMLKDGRARRINHVIYFNDPRVNRKEEQS